MAVPLHSIGLNVDWGTSYVTVAFAFYRDGVRTSDPKTLWVAARSHEEPAIATWLPDGRFVHGMALETLAETDPSISDKIIQLFKVGLSSQPGASEATKVANIILAELGKDLDDLIEDHIRATIEDAKLRIRTAEINRGTQAFDEDELDEILSRVLVRITVPDSWTPDAIRRMQMAAERAGLQHVVVASEAKAAIAFFLHQAAGEQHPLGKAFVKGNILITADIGCGTGDFVTNKLKDDLSFDSHFETLGHSNGDVCGSFQVDRLLLASLLEKKPPGWVQGTAERLGLTERDFTRRLLKAMSEIKEGFDGRKAFIASHVTGVGRHYESFNVAKETVYAALDAVIDTIIWYIKQQIKPHRQPNAILVTGGFSRSEHLMARLKNEFKGILVIRPSDTESALCYPVAMGALLRWENIEDQRLPSKYGYAILQGQYYDQRLEVHSDSWRWDETTQERIPKPWVKPSRFDAKVKIAEERLKTIITKDEQFEGAKTIEMEFFVSVEDPRIEAKFVYLTQKFQDGVASQKLSREDPKGYTYKKAVREWASVDIALSPEDLASHGFKEETPEEGERHWKLNVRVIIRKASQGMDIEFEILKPHSEAKSKSSGASKGEVAFKVTENFFNKKRSPFTE